MELPKDHPITLLTDKVTAAVAKLTTLVASYRNAEKLLVKNAETLSAAQAEREQRAEAKAELETASAVVLLRRGLTAAQAIAQADDLQKQTEAAQERENAASEERERLNEQQKAAEREIAQVIGPLTYECAMLVEGQFLAEIGTMINHSEAWIPSLTEQTSDRLFRKTKAFAIYHSRELRIRKHTASPVELAEEILEEPIVRLHQWEPHLPHSKNCKVTEGIYQAIRGR